MHSRLLRHRPFANSRICWNLARASISTLTSLCFSRAHGQRIVSVASPLLPPALILSPACLLRSPPAPLIVPVQQGHECLLPTVRSYPRILHSSSSHRLARGPPPAAAVAWTWTTLCHSPPTTTACTSCLPPSRTFRIELEPPRPPRYIVLSPNSSPLAAPAPLLGSATSCQVLPTSSSSRLSHVLSFDPTETRRQRLCGTQGDAQQTCL